jgi:putative transposase
MDDFTAPRISKMEIGKIYFFTATIHNWNHLLSSAPFKEVIVSSLKFLSNKMLIEVYGFVIMPNHIHLIWRQNQLNGKETPRGSFLKYTGHQFKKMLSKTELAAYRVDIANKQYEFWQRDSMAIELFSPDVAHQKLEYMHLNPLVEHWNLASDPSEYLYSSSSFYEHNDSRFPFLKHFGEVVG